MAQLVTVRTEVAIKIRIQLAFKGIGGNKLPKRAAKGKVEHWVPEPELEGALRSLHRSYERAFKHGESSLQQHGGTPPVFIVVCPNTVVSKLVYDWIAGE